ncbi:MAG: MCE family protein [Cyanobacteria bacterium K_DeepCast_35m_m2_023]|nr:MCE family protein [Cyanobacteria bacterium K_DeepCast_35m_m2_023]
MPETQVLVPEPQFSAYRRSSLLFGLTGSLMLLGVLALLVVQQGWFQSQFRVQVIAPSSLGLSVGTPVRLSGMRIGVLDRMALLPDGRVSLSLRIPDRYRAWISPLSTAMLNSESLLASSGVELTPAPMDPARVPTSFTVPFRTSGGLQDLITGAEATRRELTALVRSTRRIADQDLPATLKGVQGVMASSTALANTVNRELPPTTTELRATLRTFDVTGRAAARTSDEVERTLVDLRPELKLALQEMAQLMARSNALLKGLQGLLEPAGSSTPSPKP